MTVQTLTSQELDRLLAARLTVAEPPLTMVDSPLLRRLATVGRDILAQMMTEQHYAKGRIVFKEGDVGDAMYIIWSGRVAVVKGGLEAPTVLGYRGPGEIVGEMALLEDQPRSASIVALEDLRLLRIGREDFERLLSSNLAVGMDILRTLSARLREADDARNAGVRAENRLIKQVSELQTDRQRLLELQRLRQETTDLIVHDLRHPISSLFGIVKLLEMVLPEEVLQANRELLNLANSTCEHMQLLVDSLLDVARMESGGAQLKVEEVNLQSLIEEAISGMATSIEMEAFTVQSIIADDLPTIVADQEKISRVLANLLGNAIKYTPGGGQITIVAGLQDEYVRVSVTDTGPGIPPEDRERIFERFAQVSRGKSKSGSFGLGLAFCRLAVEAHGGKIWVEPGEGGVGSRFIFTLPLSAQPDNHEQE